jgi:type IV pilus assembly protein PilN
MIRINLIDVSEEKKKFEFLGLALVAGVAWLVTLAGIFFWHRGLSLEIRRLQNLIQMESKELENLKKIVGEVENIKKEKAQLENKLALIAGLEKNRYHSLRLIMDLTSLIPDEIWLEGMEFDGVNLKLKGLAVDMQSVGNFLKKMREESRFLNPQVANVKAITRGGSAQGIEVVSFELTAGYPLPQTGSVTSLVSPPSTPRP